MNQRRSSRSRRRFRLTIATLAFGIAVGVLLTSLLMLLWSRPANSVRGEQLLEAATTAEEQGDIQAAVRYLDEYLEKNPRPDVMRRLARLLQTRLEETPSVPTDSARQAFDAQCRRLATLYERILIRDPTPDPDLRRNLVMLSLWLGNYRAAEVHLVELLRVSPGDAALHVMLGRSRMELGNYSDAARDYLAALQFNPALVEAVLALADLILDHSRSVPLSEIDPKYTPDSQPIEIVVRLFDQFLSRIPAADRPYAALAEFLAHRNQTRESREYLSRALGETPGDPDVVAQTSRVELEDMMAAELPEDARMKQLQRIRDQVAAGLRTAPEHVDLLAVQSELLVNLGENEAAEQSLLQLRDLTRAAAARTFRDQFSDSRPETALRGLLSTEEQAVWMLGNLRLENAEQKTRVTEKELQEIRDDIQFLRDRDAAPGMLDFLTGRLQLIEGNWSAARDSLEAARMRLSGERGMIREIDWRLADANLKLLNPDRAIAALQQGVTEEPTWLDGRIRFVQLLMAVRRLEDARAEAVAIPSPEREVLTAEILLAMKKKKEPPAPEVPGLLRNAAERDADDLDVSLLSARALHDAGRTDEAAVLLEELRLRPDADARIWLELARQSSTRNDVAPQERTQQSLQWLDQAAARFGRSFEIEAARVAIIERELPPDGAELLAQVESRLPERTAAEGAALTYRIADAYRGLGKSTDAARVLTALADRQPSDLYSRHQLAEAARSEGNLEEYQTRLAEIERIEGPRGPVAAALNTGVGASRSSADDASPPDAVSVTAGVHF